MNARAAILTLLAGLAIFAAGFWLGRSSGAGSDGASILPPTVNSVPETGVVNSERAEDLEDPPVEKSDLSWLQKLATTGKGKPLSAQQIEAYVDLNNSAAVCFLAAFESSGDLKWLKRAAEMHPNDPRVMFSVIKFDAYPEQKREWIERLKQAAPNNSLADYLSAADHLKQGRTEDAMSAFLTAASKTGFDDYTIHTIQSAEEMYTMAGRSPAEAKAIAGFQMQLPHLKQLRDLGKEMAKMQKQSQAAGDSDRAREMAATGLQMGRQMSMGEGGSYLINQLVGIAIERNVLDALDPGAENSFLGRSLEELQRELTDQKDEIAALVKSVNLDQMSEQEMTAYVDRMKLHGEFASMKWFRDRQANR